MLFKRLFEKDSERYRRQDAIWEEVAKKQAEYNMRKKMEFESLPEEIRDKISNFKVIIAVWFSLIMIISFFSWKFSLIFTVTTVFGWIIFFFAKKKLVVINVFPAVMAMVLATVLNMKSLTIYIQDFKNSENSTGLTFSEKSVNEVNQEIKEGDE